VNETQQQGVELTPVDILFKYDGRIGRATFWGYYLGLVAVGGFLYLAVVPVTGLDPQALRVWLLIPSVWASTALAAKRLHDWGKTGVLTLVLFIPLVNVIWLIILGTAPTEGTNQYGPTREYRHTEGHQPVTAIRRPRNPTPKAFQWSSATHIDSVTDSETLRTAASDTDLQTRKAVARNPNTPPDVLESLSKTQLKGTRFAVIKNPRTPRTVVEYMAEHDEFPSIQRAANERLKTGKFDNDEELEESETDEEPEISEGADAIEPIPPNLIDDLERLADLYKQGMLSEEEFDLLKSRLI